MKYFLICWQQIIRKLQEKDTIHGRNNESNIQRLNNIHMKCAGPNGGKAKKVLMRGISRDSKTINKDLSIHLFFHSIDIYSAPGTYQASGLSTGDTP